MTLWIGVDVGGRRKGFDVAVVGDCGVLALRNRLTCQQVTDLVMTCQPAVVAIDGPRSCAPEGHAAREGELQLARQVCGIRWTPDTQHVRANPYYAWILEGLDLFSALGGCGAEVIEVFPTASWTRWHGRRGPRTRATWSGQALAALGLEGVPARTNQDQRDAIAAALTARQHTQGKTETIGGIVVPLAPRTFLTRPGGPAFDPGQAHLPRRRAATQPGWRRTAG